MISFKAVINKFGKKGEKTGWTYVDVPHDIIEQVKPGSKKSFRVKGFLDSFAIAQVALIPMGDGEFILPINGNMRKGIGKKEGAMLLIKLMEDKSPILLDQDLMACLEDDEAAHDHFNSLTTSHRNYFSKWITSAKTIETKTKRLTMAVSALSRKMGYPEMIRENKNK